MGFYIEHHIHASRKEKKARSRFLLTIHQKITFQNVMKIKNGYGNDNEKVEFDN